jgi:hypothetical protein
LRSTLTNPLDLSQLFTEQETADRLSFSIIPSIAYENKVKFITTR